MSIPLIPGYTGSPASDTLADLWKRPEGNWPAELWPERELQGIQRDPVGWLRIDEHFFTAEKHGGSGCVLVDSDDTALVLTDSSWVGRNLGSFQVWYSGGGQSGLEDGLSVREHSQARLHFMVQVRDVSGAELPVLYISQPFLWYWDAFPSAQGWSYLNAAGREQDLIRFDLKKDAWSVHVRALEFRQFLAVYRKTAILQMDHVTKLEGQPFDRMDDTFSNDWSYFTFFATHDLAMGEKPAFSGVMGQYAVTGMRNFRVPRYEERPRNADYPTFIYGMNHAAGQPLMHTCDPGKLGTYFDRDGTRLHYLTPVYFKREVLQPYAAEPGRYTLSKSRLSCLNLWGVALSFNSSGLVEVYLGDLGRDLPADEWGHWRSYNVPPEGTMDEGRFRRDFLNQWHSSADPVRDLNRALSVARDETSHALGQPIWRPLPDDLAQELASLFGPLNDDPASLGGPLLTLTKVLVDSIDVTLLRSLLVKSDKGDQSLTLLRKYLVQLGGDGDAALIFRQLQDFRSKGGVAHLAGSQRASIAAALGITGSSPLVAFESVVTRCTEALAQISSAIGSRPTE